MMSDRDDGPKDKDPKDIDRQDDLKDRDAEVEAPNENHHDGEPHADENPEKDAANE